MAKLTTKSEKLAERGDESMECVGESEGEDLAQRNQKGPVNEV